MEIRFWGVRGSVASSGPQVARMGGNTACVEVESQGHRLIFDAGTGVRPLGESLLGQGPVSATLLFSHLHWDHVQGFPFFGPAWVPTSALTLYGPGAGGDASLRSALVGQMSPPTFPVPLSAMRARLDFRSALPGVAFEVGPFRVTPVLLSHPQGCLGYHVEADGRRFAYCTDVEVGDAGLDAEAMRVLEGVDALTFDAQYTPDEYEGRVGGPKRGWGHSTWADAAGLASRLGAGRLFLFHHEPSRDDDAVEAMARQAQDVFAATEPAREGLCVAA